MLSRAVETDMQALIRSEGSEDMSKADHAFFVKLHEEGQLVKPETCGYVLAALAVNATKELSGKFISYDGEECRPYRPV